MYAAGESARNQKQASPKAKEKIYANNKFNICSAGLHKKEPYPKMRVDEIGVASRGQRSLDTRIENGDVL